MKKLLWSVLLIPFVLTSCGTKKDSGNDTAGPDFLASNIDSTIKPGDDFFLFANNGWFKKNPIPASEQSNGLWQLIRDTINAQVRQICESSAALKDAPKGSPKQKIGDMFFSGMDSINNNKLGLNALQPELDQIAAINDKASLAKAVAKIHMVSGAPLFNFYVGQDDKQSDKYAIFISQGGLSLPDRTYYVDSDDRALKIREKFPVHLKNMFQLMGNDEKKAAGSASSFMNLETTLAKASRKREDTRDPLENYHKMPVAELQQMTPAFDWNTFFTECGLQDVDTVIVGQPGSIESIKYYAGKNFDGCLERLSALPSGSRTCKLS